MSKKTIIIIAAIVLLFFLLRVNTLAGIVLLAALLLYGLYESLPIIYLIMGNRNYYRKDTEKALIWYEKAYKNKNSKVSTKATYAYILLRERYIEKSERILRELMSMQLNGKDKMDVVINLSLVLLKKGNLNEAISLLEELYDSGYKTTLLYQNLGFYYILGKYFDKALKFNLEAYEYSDSDASILDNLALTYYYLENYDKALELYEKLIPMNTTFVTVYYYYALTLEKTGDYNKALEMLNKALTCNFTFLTSVSKEEVENEIEKVQSIISSNN